MATAEELKKAEEEKKAKKASVSEVSGGIVTPSAEPDSVSKQAESMNDWALPKADPNIYSQTPAFIKDEYKVLQNYGRGVLNAAHKYTPVDYVLPGTPSNDAVSGYLTPGYRGKPQTPAASPTPAPIQQNPVDTATQVLGNNTPGKPYGADFVAKTLRDLQYRQAYGSSHGQSAQALKNDYDRTMFMLGNLQTYQQSYAEGKEAEKAGIVKKTSDGKWATLPFDKNGRPFIPESGSLTDEKGHVENVNATNIVRNSDGSGEMMTPYGKVSWHQGGPVKPRASGFVEERDEDGRPTKITPGQEYLERQANEALKKGLIMPGSPADKVNQEMNQRIKDSKDFEDVLQKGDKLAAQPGYNRASVIQTPEVEGDFKGVVEKGNIDLGKRPILRNDDGTISTVKSMSFNDGKAEVLIPTIATDKDGNPVELSKQEAINRYNKTGEHLGKFKSPQEADAYAEALHNKQAEYYRGAENYTNDSAPYTPATPEGVAAYNKKIEEDRKNAWKLPTQQQMREGFTVPGTKYQWNRGTDDPSTFTSDGTHLAGTAEYEKIFNAHQQANDALQAKRNAQEAMNRANAPIPNDDPVWNANIANDQANAALQMAAADGYTAEQLQADPTIAAKYFKDPYDFNSSSSQAKTNQLALEVLKGASMPSLVASAMSRSSPGNNNYRKKLNDQALKQYGDVADIQNKEAGIDLGRDKLADKKQTEIDKIAEKQAAHHKDMVEANQRNLERVRTRIDNLLKDGMNTNSQKTLLAKYQEEENLYLDRQADLDKDYWPETTKKDGKKPAEQVAAGVIKVNTPEEYAKLPIGTNYIDSNGKPGIKRS
jgi:hypothetical protein